MTKKLTQAEGQRLYEEGVERVVAYLKHRAAEGGVWADPTIPWYRLLGQFYADKHAPVKKPMLTTVEEMTAEHHAYTDKLCTYGDDICLTLDHLDHGAEVAELLMMQDWGTFDIEFEGSISDGDGGDFGSFFKRYRVGDQIVYTGGYNRELITPAEIRARAAQLRGEADDLDQFVNGVIEEVA